MGHTWDILVPSPLSKRAWTWDKYCGTLIFNIGRSGYGYLTLYHTLGQLKEFEDAGCRLIFDGVDLCSDWSYLYREIEECKDTELTYCEKEPEQFIKISGTDVKVCYV
jgi:hypothetical protein